MPAIPPLFDRSQGGSTGALNLVTTIREQTLTGTVDANTADIQISLNGSPFRSDPTLIDFDQTTFTVPNLNVYPEGLFLNFGVNTIKLRTVDVTGDVSSESTATIQVLFPDQVDLTSSPPTGIRLRRNRNSVEVVWAKADIPNVKGYNVYASTDPGGGDQGYYRINRDLIGTASFQEEELIEEAVDTTFLDNLYGQVGLTVDQRDFADQVLQPSEAKGFDVSLAGPRLKVTTTIETVRTTDYYVFTHDKSATQAQGTINNELFAGIPDDEPLYYVITSVVQDPVTNTEVESAYSSELTGFPLTIDTQIREIPRRTRFDVSDDYITSVLSFDDRVSLIAGSAVRDIFIDPFATEAERLYFVADFISRSQSFSTLLVLDASESYKRALAAALGLNLTTDVQPIVDDSFDKLAANSQTVRLGSEFAVGEAVFFTTSEPTTDLVVQAGTVVSTDDSIQFEVTSQARLPFANRDSYYNIQRQRYEFTANIRASAAGSAGNVPAGAIRNALGGVGSLRVTNLEATRFGRDEESNEDLAERAILAFSSVDAGTGPGYLSTALKQRGVFRAEVIEAGEEYMMRDYDDVRDKNIGGKVDVWIQGDEPVQVSDTFALRFDVERDVRFFLDSSPSDLIFIADDPRLSPETPITAVLGETPAEIAQGFAFRNLTTGDTFDLTGVSIIDFNRIQLNTAIAQPPVGPNDVISGDYRFRESDQYVFSRQPVRQVDSVTSLSSGDALAPGDNYLLYKLEDPLLEGQSTQASDYLQITPFNGVPSGDVVTINDERHVLIGQISEPLDNLGASSLTVRVFTLDRVTEYEGPGAAVPDFFIEEGDSTTPLALVRNPDGNIGNGEEVSVDYEHDENFQVTYVVNNVLQRVQSAFETQRHVTADVLAKDSISNPMIAEITIVLLPGAVQSVVDANVRTNVSQFLNSLGIGEPVHQSDILRVIENTPGVDYVVVPFARLTHQDGSLIVRETVSNTFTFLEQPAGTKIYVLQDALNYNTSDGGGVINLHRGVFQDRLPIEIVSTYGNLKSSTNTALIVGKDGLVITNYSDDATLTAAGFNTDAEREAERLNRTANKVFLSLPVSDSPANHEYEVSYTVTGDRKTESSIILSDIAHAELGELTITYRAAGS